MKRFTTSRLRNYIPVFNSKNISINVYNGIALAVAINLVNPYYAKFAERLGANEYQMAYLNSLPAFISLFALIPGAIFIDLFGNKLKSTTWIMLFHKVFFLIIAFVPLINGVSKPWLFIILIALMNLPGSIYTMGYQSSIGDIFSPSERGLAMGLRNRYSDIFRLLITFISGVLLSIPKNDAEIIFLYQIFFVISFIIGLLEVYTFSKFTAVGVNVLTDQPIVRTTHEKYIQGLKKILQAFKVSLTFSLTDKVFKQFMVASLIFHFGWQMGWPLFNIYTITKLGANEAWLSAIAIAGGITAIMTATQWAKFADKRGNTLAAVIATFGMSVTPFLYVLSDSLYMLVLFNVLIGFSITGTVLILFNLLLEATPSQNRTTIIALYNTAIAVSATIAPLAGVWLMAQTSLDLSLLITGVLRFCGCFAFFLMSRQRGARYT
jgi:MFS family permease